ncbi:MAG TPA: glutamine synthetase [Firmicutes bacterium]|nr:glutamine synthetase [Bacillota bacterium]
MREFKQLLQEREVQAVDVKVCDLSGRWRHLTFPTGSFLTVAEQGVGVDASNYGLSSVARSDARLLFDTGTVHAEPFAPVPTLGVIGQLADSRGALLPEDPRGVAQRAEVFLNSTGVADASLWLPELEWYVFQDMRLALSTYEVATQVIPYEGLTGTPCEVAPTGYHSIPPADRLCSLRARLTALLAEAGYPVKYHHHEVGAGGQIEIELAMGGLVKSGDAVMMAKYLARNLARQDGLVANFMPKPLRGQPGNGMHVHVSLLKSGSNSFVGPEYTGLSRTALQFIGGILLHAEALCAFCNPSTNSYRRLAAGQEAPASRSFGAQNRSAAVRVPGYASGRVEYRPLDATANPYLAYAAILMAGLDGIRKVIDPTAEGFGPFEVDLDQNAGAAPRLPATLQQALDCLERDHEFLLEGEVFPPSLISAWLERKRAECREIGEWPHPWELAVYGDL